MSAPLSFTIHGSLVSNNRTTRRFGSFSVKSAEAREDQARVFQLAFAAAHEVGWQKPAAATVIIHAYSTRKDADNIAKSILDGMIGAVYDDDRCVIGLNVAKFLDHDGERYEVTVYPSMPLRRPPKPRKARKPPTPGVGT